MEKHKKLRERFGNVLPTDNAVEVLEAIEQWLIEREAQALRIHDVVGRSEQLMPICSVCGMTKHPIIGAHCKASNCPHEH